MSIGADAADGADGVMQLVSPMAVILIVRVPNRPSRPKAISIPTVRKKVCARRSRPARARGLFGQPVRLVPTCKRSDALPVHCARSAMSSRTWTSMLLRGVAQSLEEFVATAFAEVGLIY